MLTITVCLTILGFDYKWISEPVGSVPDESRKMFYDILVFIVGLIGGYISHGEGGNNDKN
jgi:hypothetical protein